MNIFLDYNKVHIPDDYKDECFVLDTLNINRVNVHYNDLQFPLAFRNFILYKNLIRAPFLQRINFKEGKILEEDLLLFLKSKFRNATCQLNTKIETKNINTDRKENFILRLDREYDKIFSSYSSDTKRILTRQREQDQLIMRDINFFTFKKFASSHVNKDIPTFYRNVDRYSKIIEQTCAMNTGMLKGVFWNEKLITVAYLRWSRERLQFLMPVSDQDGKVMKATTFLIDHIIKSLCGQALIFDFSGSSIPSIAAFMKNFGVETEYYYSYSW